MPFPNPKPPTDYVLDTGNSLATGLASAWLLNEGTGVPVNIITATPIAAFARPAGGGSVEPTWQTSSEGEIVFEWTEPPTNTDLFMKDTSVPAELAGGPISFHAYVNFFTGGDDQNVIDRGSNGNWRFRRSTGNVMQLLDRGGTNLLATTDTVADDEWHFVGFVADDTGLYIYIDGLLSESNATPFGGGGSADVFMPQGNFYGQISHMYKWDVALDAGDMLSLATDPYAMWVPGGPPPPPPSGPSTQPWVLTDDDVDADPPLLVDVYPKHLKWVGDDIADGDELQISDQNGHVVFRHFATAADTGVTFDFPKNTVWHGFNLDSCPTGELYLYF